MTTNDAGMTKHYLNGRIEAVKVTGFNGTVLELVETVAAHDQEAATVATCANWRPTASGSTWFYTTAWEIWLDAELVKATPGSKP